MTRVALTFAGGAITAALAIWLARSGQGLGVLMDPLFLNGLAFLTFLLAGPPVIRWLAARNGRLARIENWLGQGSRIANLLAVLLIPGSLITCFAILQGPWLSADSWHYMSWASWRTAGYPLVLWLLAATGAGFALVPLLQLVGTICLPIALALTLKQHVSSLVALGVSWFLLTSWPYFYNTNLLLTDQLFIVCVGVMVAAAAAGLATGQRRYLLLVWFVILLAMFLRPVGITLLVPAALLTWLMSASLLQWLIRFAPAALAVILLVSASNLYLFGYFRTSALGGTALAVASYCLPADEAADPLMQRLEPSAASLCNALSLPGSEADWYKRAQSEITIAVSAAIHETRTFIDTGGGEVHADHSGVNRVRRDLVKIDPELFNAAIFGSGGSGRWPEGEAYWPAINDLLGDLAVRRMAEAPLDYLMFSLRKAASGWLEVVPVFSATRNLGPQTVFDPRRDGLTRPLDADWWKEGASGILARVMDWAGAPGYLLVRHLGLPALVLVLGLWSLGTTLTRRAAGTAVPVSLGLAAFCAVMLFTYHGAIAATAIMIPRLATPGLIPAWVLVFSALWSILAAGKKGDDGNGDRLPVQRA